MVSIQLSRSRTSDEHDVEACVLQVGIHHQMRDFAVLVSLSHPVRSRLMVLARSLSFPVTAWRFQEQAPVAQLVRAYD